MDKPVPLIVVSIINAALKRHTTHLWYFQVTWLVAVNQLDTASLDPAIEKKSISWRDCTRYYPHDYPIFMCTQDKHTTILVNWPMTICQSIGCELKNELLFGFI